MWLWVIDTSERAAGPTRVNPGRSEALGHRTKNMNKTEKYASLLPQVQAVMDEKADIIANMANMAAMLHETFGFWWTGFYRVIGGELVLGPFHGPLACTRIAYGRGVCGTAWKERRTVVVPDVEQFPGHIACDSASNSELVIPIRSGGKIVGVLDLDSPEFDRFSAQDQAGLEGFVRVLEEVTDFSRLRG